MWSKSIDRKTYKDIKKQSTENDLITRIYKEDPILENGDSIVEYSGYHWENCKRTYLHFSSCSIQE